MHVQYLYKYMYVFRNERHYYHFSFMTHFGSTSEVAVADLLGADIMDDSLVPHRVNGISCVHTHGQKYS